MKKLLTIQNELKVPKDKKNTFANFNYRNAEGILEKVKPLLIKHDCVLTLNDDIIEVGGRVYVKATATIKDDKESVSVSASAREQDSKKGMDEAQITGAASSYARKYALSGLFLLDDGNDPDSHDNSSEGTQKQSNDESSKDYPATDKTKAFMNGLYKNKFIATDRTLADYITEEYGWIPAELTQEQASTIIDDLKAS